MISDHLYKFVFYYKFSQKKQHHSFTLKCCFLTYHYLFFLLSLFTNPVNFPGFSLSRDFA